MTRAVRETGFTLLEVLAALVVLSALLLALRQGVAVGVSASETQARLAAGREDLDAVARALRRLVEHMDPGTDLEPVHVDAGPHALAFPTELPAAVSLPQPAVDAALLVTETGELVLRWTPRRHAVRLTPPPPPQQTQLLRGVAGLDIAYWRPSAGGGGWVPEWPGPGLPTLVRLRIIFPRDDRRHWPDIVAAPMRDMAQQ
ncbi:MAG: prepilin-type N-terminal cleavage/methylation domain-containing protein [Acetobacteraceae bacterium]|nr:prepilin-type N-terminal cleavage/methylation domain-containing protein [Acetobacteraceae bacterium]